MRHPATLIVGLIAASIALTGCGRVSSTQVARPATGAAAKQAAGVQSGGQAGTRTAPTVNMMAAGVGSARGRVVDKATGRPLAGLTVVAKSAGLRATTDANGAFVIGGLTGGNHEFEVLTSGLVMEMPAGTLVMPNTAADVPVIAMVPGAGKSAGLVSSVTYVKERELGRDGEAPATLVNPIGVAARGADVQVLDLNNSAFVKTGVIRQYDAEAGSFEGKFGDYSKWFGFSEMKNTVLAITLDNQGRSVVLDGAKKLWRYDANGKKQKASDLSVDGLDIATDATGSLLIAGSAGITKLNPEGEGPQQLGELTDCRAVAGGKDGIWAIAGGKVAKLGTDGTVMMEFGAGGTDGTQAFTEAVDLAVDPRNGHVIVVDKGAKQVYVYDGMGMLIGKVGQGLYEQPVAATVDAGGRVYVVDQAKKKVYKFLPGVTR